MKQEGINSSILEGLLTLALILTACVLSVWPNPLLAYGLGTVLIALILFNTPKVLSDIRFSVIFWSGIVLITASIGLWAAYQTTNALPKFLNLALGLLIAVYFSKVSSLKSWEIWSLASGSLFFTAVFALTKLNILEPAILLTPNRLAGLSAIFVPFLVLAWQKSSSTIIRTAIVAAGLIVSAGLILSGSRGAIGAIFVSLLIWYLLTNQNLFGKNRQLLGQLVFYAAIVIGFSCIYFIDGIHNSPLANIPGADSRIELYANSQHLVSDFWVMGGGLNSFGGLYSQYIVSVPFLLFTYGHNLYLNLLLEQGIFGLLAVIGLLFGSLFIGFKQIQKDEEDHHLVGAAIASVIILLLHGFIDDAIYGDFGSPFLFMGAAILFSKSKPAAKTDLLPIHISTAILLLAVIVFGSFGAAARSNLVSIKMAKIQLSQWPTNEWSSGENNSQLAQVGSEYQALIAAYPEYAPNFYHLGLITAEAKNFNQAKENFERSYTLAPDHLGIKKNLGLALLWTGDQAQAIKLLKDVPGVDGEIDAYVWWWGEQGEQELSKLANELKNDPEWINR